MLGAFCATSSVFRKSLLNICWFFSLTSEVGAVFAHIVEIIAPDVAHGLYQRLLRIALMAEGYLLNDVVKVRQQIAAHEIAFDHT